MFVGIDVGSTAIKLGLVDIKGKLISYFVGQVNAFRIWIFVNKGSLQACLWAYVKLIQCFRRSFGTNKEIKRHRSYYFRERMKNISMIMNIHSAIHYILNTSDCATTKLEN